MLRVGHTHSIRLDDRGQLLAGRRLGVERKVAGHVGTGDVEDLDCDDRQTSALVAECEVDALLGDGHAAHLGVDDHLKETFQT